MMYIKKIPFTLAALGGDVTIPTLDGDVSLKIPAGTEPHTVMSLKAKGMPRLEGRGRGDMKVIVEIDMPHKLSAEEKKLLQQLDQLWRAKK